MKPISSQPTRAMYFGFFLIVLLGLSQGHSIGTPLDSFKPVVPGKTFRFPEDHRPHYGYKTEWWYYTGFMESNPIQGKSDRYGIQYTIFKIELEPVSEINGKIPPHPPIVLVTHVGITDIEKQSFRSHTDVTRVFPGLAGFQSKQDGFVLQQRGKNLTSHYEIRDNKHKVRITSITNPIIEFNIIESSPVLFQGKNGFSPKDSEGTASYYYSIPILKGEGSVFANGEYISGKIELWLDREFSSQFLRKEKSGWDWVHFGLDDGRKIVAFQVRDKDPGKDYTYSMVWNGKEQVYPHAKFTPLSYSRSKSGRRYPIEWKLHLGDEEFTIKSSVKDCEMEGLLPYWEGPITVHRSKEEKEKPHGKGYLEMTGYGEPLPDWL